MAETDNSGSAAPGMATLSGWQTTVSDVNGRMIELSANTARITSNLSEAEKAGMRFGRSLTGAFEALAFRGKGLGDVLKSLALSMSQIVLKAAFAPLQNSIGSFVGTALKGFGFKSGAAFQNGSVVPFAQGGVISSPIAFPLSGGRMGIAGEAGAEAIMPLMRGPDGRLGVAARGGGAPPITINIAASDVESFRRSEGQVAAMIARAAALGQRNL
jgi:phage-related minor tail protein